MIHSKTSRLSYKITLVFSKCSFKFLEGGLPQFRLYQNNSLSKLKKRTLKEVEIVKSFYDFYRFKIIKAFYIGLLSGGSETLPLLEWFQRYFVLCYFKLILEFSEDEMWSEY